MDPEIEKLTAQLYTIIKNADFDPGHKCLLTDLLLNFRHAANYEFHDFRNKLFATPKMALCTAMDLIKEKTQKGDYDN